MLKKNGDKWEVSFSFENEEEAKKFDENAITAYHTWRFMTGKIKGRENDLQEHNTSNPR